jgi:predicted nucleotidyltransferase
MADDQAFLSARVPVDIRNRFKALAASKGLNVQELLREVVGAYVEDEATRIPEAGTVIRTIKAHSNDLRAAGILHLALVGSVARGEATEASDIDLVADFEPDRKISLIDVAHVQDLVQGYVGERHRVDLSVRKWLKDVIAEDMRPDEIGIL